MEKTANAKIIRQKCARHGCGATKIPMCCRGVSEGRLVRNEAGEAASDYICMIFRPYSKPVEDYKQENDIVSFIF